MGPFNCEHMQCFHSYIHDTLYWWVCTLFMHNNKRSFCFSISENWNFQRIHLNLPWMNNKSNDVYRKLINKHSSLVYMRRIFFFYLNSQHWNSYLLISRINTIFTPDCMAAHQKKKSFETFFIDYIYLVYSIPLLLFV